MAYKADRGAAAVEAAIVMPLLLLLVFGIIEFGLLLNTQLKLTEAAREGARAATVSTDSDAAQDRVDRIDSGFTVATGSSDFCGANPGPGDDAVVVVRYRYEFLTPLGGLIGLFGGAGWGSGIDLSSKGVMPCRA